MERAARVSHAALYLPLGATPVLGLLAYHVGGPFGGIHGWNKPLFIGLIGIHSVAALYHHLWLRDGTLRRKLSPARGSVELRS